jgi:hypothetical protein
MKLGLRKNILNTKEKLLLGWYTEMRDLWSASINNQHAREFTR